MRCEEFGQVLSEYIEGELGPREEERVEHHLLQCPACSATLRGVQQVRAALRCLGRQDLPPHFQRTLSHAIVTHAGDPPVRRWSGPVAWGMAMVVGAVVLLWPAPQERAYDYAAGEWDPNGQAAYLDEAPGPPGLGVYADDQEPEPPALAGIAVVQVRPVSF